MTKKIGLNAEEVRQLLMEKHETVLAEDDPILMLVTLQNAFVEDYNRLLLRHHDAMKNTMKSVLNETVHDLREVSDSLMDETVRTTIENTIAEISVHKTAMDSFLNEMRLQHYINIICAVICLGSFLGVIFLERM